jgi:UDP-glucose:(heptosyl)LPS alpha-1,3-glucosyltransferase
MHLALVRQRYNPFGGAERFVERALDALAGEGLAVTLIARHWSDEGRRRVLRCDPFHLGRLWRDVSFAACVRRTLARQKFDLVQSHERIPGCQIYRAGDGVHATWLALRARVQSPLARLASRLAPWHRYTLAAEARLYRHPALRAVICNSRMVRDDIAARFGVAAEKLHVIYNGVDLDAWHPRLRTEFGEAARSRLAIPPDVPVFLCVGSGYERKGVARLLRAFAALPARQPRLLVVGRDRRQADYERLAAALGIGARVAFLGAQQDVRPWYGAADAAVLATLYDPFPNAAVEALACGLPLVTTTTCGAAELIRPGRNGFVCDPLDLPALTRHLEILAQAGRAAAMSAAARDSVSALTPAAMAQRLTALYRELLAAAA